MLLLLVRTSQIEKILRFFSDAPLERGKRGAMKNRMLRVSAAFGVLAFAGAEAAEPEAFRLNCSYLEEYSVRADGIRPGPPKSLTKKLQERSRITLAYRGKDKIYWMDSKGNLVRHMTIVQRNNRLLTAIMKRPINDGISVFALDLETGLMNLTLTIVDEGEGSGDPDWVLTNVQTYKCRNAYAK